MSVVETVGLVRLSDFPPHSLCYYQAREAPVINTALPTAAPG